MRLAKMRKRGGESKCAGRNGQLPYGWGNDSLINCHSTHRDRKATYVKALEMEVAKLRAKDAHYSDGMYSD
jgi:hypothetical protein